jgi:hypothetical protein
MSASSAECARPARSAGDAEAVPAWLKMARNHDHRPARNPARAARRETELREKLGAERPVCIYCGYAEPVVMRRVSRRFLLEHHVLGRQHDPLLTVFVCLNCNALLHQEMLPDAEVDLRPEPDPVRRVATMLRAEAVHLEMLASSKRRQAALLEGDGSEPRSLSAGAHRRLRK